jgi:hypothetical protein
MVFEPNTKIKQGSWVEKIWICVREISFIPHGRGAIFCLNFKPGYLEHMNLDFRSEKCMVKLRLRDTQ